MKVVHQSVEVLAYTKEPEKLIELAGRTCYKSKADAIDDSEIAFIKKLLIPKEPGGAPHESVIEHASATFRIVCDRGISHEIVRHRIASFSQESTRYCNYSKTRHGEQISVIEPPGLFEEARSVWYECCAEAESAYLTLLEQGVKPEIARSVLPTCLKTELVMTMNFREIRHFLQLRLSKRAHPQIRQIAKMLWYEMREISPTIFDVDLYRNLIADMGNDLNYSVT